MHFLSNISFYCFFWHLCNNSFYFFVSSYYLLRGFMNCLLNTTMENTYLCIQKSFMHHQQDFYQSLVIINRYQIIFSLMYVFHVWMVQTDFMNDVQASQYEHFCHEVALCWLSIPSNLFLLLDSIFSRMRESIQEICGRQLLKIWKWCGQ